MKKHNKENWQISPYEVQQFNKIIRLNYKRAMKMLNKGGAIKNESKVDYHMVSIIRKRTPSSTKKRMILKNSAGL